VKQDRRAVSSTWVSSFVFVVLVLLLLIAGGVSGSKLRSWRKYPNLNPWSIGKPSPRCRHTMVSGSDGSLWSFGGIVSVGKPGSLRYHIVAFPSIARHTHMYQHVLLYRLLLHHMFMSGLFGSPLFYIIVFLSKYRTKLSKPPEYPLDIPRIP
jgi:hypothetical protein